MNKNSKKNFNITNIKSRTVDSNNFITASDFNLVQVGIKIDVIPQITKDYLSLYYIRQVEKYISQKYPLNIIRTPVHLCLGQEAIPVGVSNNLFHFDKVLSGHRSHGHFLSKGGSLTSLFAELLGKESGCAKGRGGSQHLIDLDVNFIASAPILGGTIPIGVGLAFANKLLSQNSVVVSYFGDAVLEEGIFWESISFAALHKLSILFVLENNRLSVHTDISLRQPDRQMIDIANAFNVASRQVNGNNVSEVSLAAGSLISQIRGQQGPAILFCETYRQIEHVGPNDDLNLGYRNLTEHKYWVEKDPLIITKSQIEENGTLSNEIKDNLTVIDDYIESCWDTAIHSNPPILVI